MGLLTEIGHVEIRMPTGLPRQFIGTDSAKVVLAKIREVVEGEYNPFNEPECEEDSNRYSGFEVARQAILKAMGD